MICLVEVFQMICTKLIIRDENTIIVRILFKLKNYVVNIIENYYPLFQLFVVGICQLSNNILLLSIPGIPCSTILVCLIGKSNEPPIKMLWIMQQYSSSGTMSEVCDVEWNFLNLVVKISLCLWNGSFKYGIWFSSWKVFMWKKEWRRETYVCKIWHSYYNEKSAES